MGFHEIRFPAGLSFGAAGGPERRTEIVTLASGYEERNTPWEHSLRRYDAGLGLRSPDDLEQVLAFFEARRGQLHGFRWKDWADWRSAVPSQGLTPYDQRLGTGDGVTRVFPLVKAYRSGEATYLRPIAKPVAGTVLVALGGDPVAVGGGVEVAAATGEVTFATAPDIGAEITAGFEFDVPVRFDTDRIHISMASFRAGEIPAIPVVEVRL
jgi:uncharacterized protein (TIGR02217 family)